jgi:hypothetical protein
MDSVFLRARSLFEFFMGEGRENYCHARCLFGLSNQLYYDRYTRRPRGSNSSWKDVLHYGSIHIQDRGNPVQLDGYNGDLKDLSEMPVDFARGMLDVRNFSRWMSPVGVRRLSWRSPGWCSGLVG